MKKIRPTPVSLADRVREAERLLQESEERCGFLATTVLQGMSLLNAEFEETEERLRLMLEVAPDAIVMVDLETKKFIFANHKLLQILGYTPDELTRMTVFNIHPSHTVPGILQRFEQYKQGGSSHVLDMPLLCKDGTVILADLAASKLILNHQECVVGIFRDVTLRNQAQQYTAELAAARAAADMASRKAAEIAAAYDELQRAQDLLIHAEKLSALGVLSAGVAHELNNPLAGILSVARYHLQSKDPNDKDYGDFREIAAAGERMAKIIAGLLDYSRPSSGDKKELNCNVLIEDTLGFGLKFRPRSGVDVRKDFEQGLPVILADENRIHQVILNLLNNAFDAMQGRGVLEIATRTCVRHERRFVEMEFTDNGCGIPREHLARVFEPFFTTKRPGKGTGLGLAVIHSIVEQLGGDIQVESPPAGREAGTSFKVSLPAAQGPLVI